MWQLAAVVLGVCFGMVAGEEVCPLADWKKLPLTKDPVEYATFNATVSSLFSGSMDMAVLQEYGMKELLPRAGANAALFILALVTLFIFLLWRLFYCCCACCCCKDSCDAKRANADADKLLKGGCAATVKVVMCLLGITCLALTAYGMVNADPELATELWPVVDTTQAFLGGINTNTTALKDSSLEIYEDGTCSGATTPDGGALKTLHCALLDNLDPHNLAPTVQDAINNWPFKVDNGIFTPLAAVSSLSNTLESFQTDYTPLLKTVDKYRYMGTMVFYGLGIFFLLLLTLASLCNWSFGVGCCSFLSLLLLTLYGLVGLVMALVLVASSDGCANIDALALDKAPTELVGLADYYLNHMPAGATIEQVLQTALSFNSTAVSEALTTQLADLNSSIYTAYSNSPPATVVASLTTLVADGADLNTALGGLLSSLDYDAASPTILGAKEYVCCSTADTISYLWVSLTFGGGVGLLTVFLGLSVLGRLDKLPSRMVGCCGCSCICDVRHAAKRFKEGVSHAGSRVAQSVGRRPGKHNSGKIRPADPEAGGGGGGARHGSAYDAYGGSPQAVGYPSSFSGGGGGGYMPAGPGWQPPQAVSSAPGWQPVPTMEPPPQMGAYYPPNFPNGAMMR